MFTPPPSPRPLNLKHAAPVQANTSAATLSPPSIPNDMPSHDRKRQTGRRFKWAVLIVPLVLILITASTQYLTHPAAFDAFSPTSPKEWSRLLAQTKDWRLHRRHPTPQTNAFDSEATSSSADSSSTAVPILSPTPSVAVVPQPTPTKPSAPPTLPTPFPQPFDPQLTLNFSSVSCLGFFTNMTQSAAFRPCRPFSLLSQSSADFITVC
ncbi:hypothetical protein P691DRAFT_810633 [Macrolepiota fuliginosa MF-IS2]|uniref:DUF7729 domain-containing protein n=1 Tax=Macrolepiota fuliginosa MF-IS2 TaxID=1400762 RepID=A0A9P5XFA8_9AGAR|nr:hypothetical protein P691DRAFT_810633 [Macrolepiota fuliginosa MF-IS2]